MYTVSERVVVVVVKCNDRGWVVGMIVDVVASSLPHSSTTSRMQSRRRRRRASFGEGEDSPSSRPLTKKVEMVETAGYCRAVLV